jgi:O-antigen/teichoic acid export membrane protein
MGAFRGEPDSSPRRLISGVVSGAGGWIVVSVLGALATHEMALRYGPRGYSIFVAAMAFGSVVENFTDLGLFQVLQRDIARKVSRASDLMGLVVGLRLTLSAVVVPIAATIGFAIYRHHSFSLRIAIVLILLALPLAAVQQVALAYYSATARLETVAIIGVIKQIVFVLLVALFIVHHFSVVYCVSATLVGSVVSTVVSILWVRREIRLRFVVQFRVWRKMLAETTSVGLSSIIGIFYLNADILLLSVLSTSKQLGYYGVAYAVISVFQVVPTLLSRAILTTIVRTAEENLSTIVNVVIVYYAIAGALIAALAVVSGASVVRLYAGPHFSSAILPLQILSCGQIFLFMSSGLSNISIARGYHRKLFQCGLIGFVLNVALNLALIPHFGIRGSAVATTGCEVLLSLIMARIVRRDLKVIAHIIRASWRAILSAAAPCVILWHWYGHSKETVLSGFILMIPTGFLFLLVLVLLGGIPKEMVSMIREFMPRKKS